MTKTFPFLSNISIWHYSFSSAAIFSYFLFHLIQIHSYQIEHASLFSKLQTLPDFNSSQYIYLYGITFSFVLTFLLSSLDWFQYSLWFLRNFKRTQQRKLKIHTSDLFVRQLNKLASMYKSLSNVRHKKLMEHMVSHVRDSNYTGTKNSHHLPKGTQREELDKWQVFFFKSCH